MSSTNPERAELPARTRGQAAEMFRRPSAPGAIGFRDDEARWEENVAETAAFQLGREALELAVAELVHHLRDPVDVHRGFSIAPEPERTVLCYLDLETVRDGPDGQLAPTPVGFKLKNSPISPGALPTDELEVQRLIPLALGRLSDGRGR